MEILSALLEGVRPLFRTVIAVVIAVILLIVAQRLMERRAGVSSRRFSSQLLMLGLSFAGLLAVIMTLPVSEGTRGQLLSLIGIILSAALALSSTTLVGNAMAGFMLRAVRSFRSGDFIRVGEHFGRVSERGLFHIEIQTEDRDLTTLPNLYLATHPVTVTYASGTVVSATVSLGYDVPRSRVKEVLLQAAGETELKEPFVQILELGDFSITYRVAGLLCEVKQILTVRSRLREKMLDALHGAGIEIVSPSFMNTRALAADQLFIPSEKSPRWEAAAISSPEALVFDKAEEAELVDRMREEHRKLGEEIQARTELLKAVEQPHEKERLEARITELKEQQEALADAVRAKESELKDKEKPPPDSSQGG
jgi:small-conductance mechanosensitive channel